MLQNLVVVAGALTCAAPAPGFVVVGGNDAPDEAVMRRLATRIAGEGVDAFLAADMIRPRPDARAEFEAGVTLLNEARGLFDRGAYAKAVSRYDQAIERFQANATALADLDVLRVALMERAECGLQLGDSATAETAFIRALTWDVDWQPRSTRLGDKSRQLLTAVREVVRRRPRGKLIVDSLPSAAVQIGFSGTVNTGEPIELSAGSHFVSVSAPGRATMVVTMTVRAGYETRQSLRPPLEGNRSERARALEDFDPEAPDALADVALQSGLQFIVLFDEGEITLFDERGAPVNSDAVQIASPPSPAELQTAARQLVSAAAAVSPELVAKVDPPGHWYTSWWGISLMATAVAGVAVGTALIVTRPNETEFLFVP